MVSPPHMTVVRNSEISLIVKYICPLTASIGSLSPNPHSSQFCTVPPHHTHPNFTMGRIKEEERKKEKKKNPQVAPINPRAVALCNLSAQILPWTYNFSATVALSCSFAFLAAALNRATLACAVSHPLISLLVSTLTFTSPASPPPPPPPPPPSPTKPRPLVALEAKVELEGYIAVCPSTDWRYCSLCGLYCCCGAEACGPVDVNRVASAGVHGIEIGVGVGMEGGVGIVELRKQLCFPR